MIYRLLLLVKAVVRIVLLLAAVMSTSSIHLSHVCEQELQLCTQRSPCVPSCRYTAERHSPPPPINFQMMTQRRAEELYQNELAKYNEENSMLTHAANNERRWVAVAYSYVSMQTP